jgi:hypothetical protein
MLPSRQIRPQREYCRAPIGIELQHLDRVAQVKVEDLVGFENVHLGERAGLQQIVDGGAGGTRAARKLYGLFGGIGPAERTALDRVRFQLQQRLDLARVHVTDVSSAGQVE